MAQTNSMRYTGIPPVTGVRIVHLFFLYPDHAVSPAVPTLPGTEADDPVINHSRGPVFTIQGEILHHRDARVIGEPEHILATVFPR